MDPDRRRDLAARLHAAAVHLLRRARREDAAAGLTPARLSVLSVLVFGDARTVGELAAAEQVTAPTMSRLLSRLEADGYVTRAPDPADARVVVVRPTAEARRVLEEGRRRRIQHVVDLLAGLDDSQWAGVEEALRAIEGALAPGGAVPPTGSRGASRR